MEVGITGVAKGLKVPCLFMIAEVSIRYQKNPGGWYMAYTPQYTTVFTFLVPPHPGSPGKRAVKRVCVPSKQEILIDSKCRLSAATIWQ